MFGRYARHYDQRAVTARCRMRRGQFPLSDRRIFVQQLGGGGVGFELEAPEITPTARRPVPGQLFQRAFVRLRRHG
jgi:hypothetical protein